MVSRKKSNSLLKQLFSLAGNRQSQRIFLVLGVFVFIYFFLLLSVLPMGFRVEEGMPSPQTIYAPREAIDHYITSQLREEAASAVPEVYEHDDTVVEEGRDVISDFFYNVQMARAAEGEEREELISQLEDELSEELSVDISRNSLEYLSGMSLGDLSELHERVDEIFVEVMEQGVQKDEVEAAQEQISQEINPLPYSTEAKQGMERLLVSQLHPNMIYNEEVTEANREAARQEIEPVRIQENSLIVQEGERVTEHHVAQLETLGLLGPRVHISGYVGLFLILIIIFLIVGLYLFYFNRDIYDNVVYLSLLSLIVVLTLLLGLAAQFFSAFFMPLAMAGILITILFEPRLAVLFNVVLAILLGFVVDGEFVYIVVALVGGLVAIYSVSKLQQRSDLTRAGINVAVINMFSIVALFLLNQGFILEYEYLREFSIAVLSGVGNGLFSAVMAIGLLPYLESTFGLTTAITLLELGNPGRTLLRKLLMDTPGTYHHSIMVGNLAEAAAEEIDADPLLCRVGAFYHDIGKVRRPYFFVENQFTGDNPHKKISPNLSALIIRSHVKDGVEMAKKEKLPLPIIEIIQQHHGSGLISFFYRQALEKMEIRESKENREKGGTGLSEEDFRYQGPLPQTKEAAIILLADAVEAAVRSLSRPIAGRVEGMVRRIIKEKLNDGQFDEAPLTLKDLDRIGDTFVYVLSGLFHQRIEYPEKELRADLAEGGSKNGGAGK